MLRINLRILIGSDFEKYVELETNFKSLATRIDEITTLIPDLEQEISELVASNHAEIVVDDSIKYKIISNNLTGPYSNFYVDTVKLLKKVDKPSLLENGIERCTEIKSFIRLVKMEKFN
jgi:hypothetical protein